MLNYIYIFIIIIFLIIQVIIIYKINYKVNLNSSNIIDTKINTNINPKKYPTNYSTKVLSVPATMNFRSNKSTYDPRFDGTIPVTPDDFLFYNSSTGEGAFSVVVDGTYTFNFSSVIGIVNEERVNTFSPNDRTYMYLIEFGDNSNPVIMKSIQVYQKKSWSIENVRLFAGTVYRITICYDKPPYFKIHCPDLKVQVNVEIPKNLLKCDIKQRKVDINPEWCNIIVSDPWELHGGPGVNTRYSVVCSRISKFVDMMRIRGSTIIWCVSDRFYFGQPDTELEKNTRNNLLKIPETPFQTNYKREYGDGSNGRYITLYDINLTATGGIPPQNKYASLKPSPLMNIDPVKDYLADESKSSSYKINTLSQNKRLIFVGFALDQCLLTTRGYSAGYFTGIRPNVVFVDLTDYSGVLDPSLVKDVVDKDVYSRKDVFKYIYKRFNKDHIVQPGIFDETTLGD